MGQSLSARITARIDLIARWLKKGVPPDLVKIPSTLNGWREFHNPDLGILRIGSKAGFTTTDPDLGSHVLRLQGLIAALNDRMGVEAKKKEADQKKRRTYRPEATRRRLAESERDAALRDVRTVTGHWHAARHDLELKTKKEKELKAIVLDLHATVKDRDDRIQFLLGRLRGAGLREV
ncbi:hypothetical protein [Rhizobium leguminosarum]|uniref:hypothetical protein n=1 Tax=Rhizobium leguminosarum TaxID=384 RepID=UPI0010321857|nr:hypothetical protein [Rhizobium leguminosarum]TAY99678.1 hypothetical protein ELH79_14835 [Rhizobium leguminosarum]TAZ10548.1 hypothetical protein ELH78_15720 [Rhizobium leguminosarum]